MKKYFKKPICPKEKDFNIEFAKKLLEYLGADISKIKPDWCWIDIYKNYSEYIDAAITYFEEAETGDPEYALLRLNDCGLSMRIVLKSFTKIYIKNKNKMFKLESYKRYLEPNINDAMFMIFIFTIIGFIIFFAMMIKKIGF